MTALKNILLVFLAVQCSQADMSVKDFIFWTKADITAWHEYFPSRLLEQERLTIQTAKEATTTLYNNIQTNLAATVKYQAQELKTAEFIMEGTSAQGCVNGIANYMDKAIQEASETFQDCVNDVPSKLSRLSISWAKIFSSYNTSYAKALAGVDICARTYPNKDSWSRLKSCVNSWINNYFSAANSTVASLGYTTCSDVYTTISSKAMGVFIDTVATCAQDAAQEVVSKGKRFLSMLVQCAKLSENVDSVTYEEQLTSEFNQYITSNDLKNQTWSAMAINSRLVSAIEKQMIYSYDLQKRALEKYVIESRGEGYYYYRLAGNVWKYSNTISSTSSDNPADADCVTDAYSALYKSLDVGASEALACDAEIVNNTKFLLARANNYFSQINKILPYTGNFAILTCFSKGYIFAEQTIYNCFNVELNSYKLNITELNSTIVNDIGILQGYEASFYSNYSIPCGDRILGRVFVEADRTLYELQRCLYINRGTKYAVTTLAPYTTTYAPTAQTTPSTPSTPTTTSTFTTTFTTSTTTSTPSPTLGLSYTG